jgi:cation diffusion facilitator family transporter
MIAGTQIPWGAPHRHGFGQDRVREAERRTRVVIALTALMMVAEIAAGILFGSMALLADGLHMASHAAALAVNAFAYHFARRHAHDTRLAFGTGKVNALGGFTGALLLLLFAAVMAGESLHRLLQPVPIAFNQAILVAVVGLLVNAISVWILGDRHDHDHDHDHAADGDHDDHDHDHDAHGHGDDHNLRAAYLHVLADALTSVLAIAALLAGKWWGLSVMDPVVGIAGALLVGRWSVGLLRAAGGVLLDAQAPVARREALRTAIEEDGDSRVLDLHLWTIAPGLFAAELTVESGHAQTAEAYKQRLADIHDVAHLTIEVRARR